MPGIRDSFDSLRSLHAAEWGSGATESTVAALESTLGCRLPDDYREFLLEFGWFESPSVTIHGIATDEHADAVLDVMRWEQNETVNPLPANLLPFSNDGAGNLSCIILSGPAAGTAVLVDHDRDDPDEVEPEASSFADWLKQRLRGGPT